jgi:hypothetical protein
METEINRLSYALKDISTINQNLTEKIKNLENGNQNLRFIGYLRSKISNLDCILDESNSSDFFQKCECKRCQFDQFNEYLSSAAPKIIEYILFLFVFLSLWYIVFTLGHAWKSL